MLRALAREVSRHGLHGSFLVAAESLASWRPAIDGALLNPVQQSMNHSGDFVTLLKWTTYVDADGFYWPFFVPGAGNVFPAALAYAHLGHGAQGLFGFRRRSGLCAIERRLRGHETRTHDARSRDRGSDAPKHDHLVG